MSFERSQLVHEISSVRFTPVRLREGYDFTEVDEILDRLAAAITAGELVDDVVRGARFTEVRLREGYAKAEVDAFLLRVVERARTLPADEPVDAEPPVVEYRPLPPPDAPSSPSVIQEQRGLLARLFDWRSTGR